MTISLSSAPQLASPAYRSLRGWLLCLLLAGSPGVGLAGTAMESGVQAYRQGDFPAALEYFRQAAAEQPDDSAVQFNLGLTLYRTGDYVAARKIFLRLRREPGMSAIAEYHLGLVAARLGQSDRAARHLRAAAAGDSGRLRELARAALARLGERPDARTATAYAMLGAGFDDNRNRVAKSLEIAGQDTESAYVDMVGQGVYPLPWQQEFDALATVFKRDYETDDELDQSSMQFALRRTWRPGAWRLSLAAESESILLRDNSLVQSLGVGAEAVRRVGKTTLRLRYQPAHVSADSDFDYLDGRRQRALVAQDVNLGGLQLRAGYELHQSAQGDAAGADIVYGQAPLRHGPFLRVSRALTPRLEASLNASWRVSRYDDDALDADRREDDLLQAGATLRFQAGRDWGLLLDYRFTENRSSVDDYDHDRSTLLAGFEWRY
jgi:tetratricopeptide (TPR) repeat protein